MEKPYHIKRPLRHQIYRLKIKIHKFIVNRTKIPICTGAEGPCFKKGKRRRQMTAYANDKLNWVFLCDGCAIINDERWAERWDEYYSSVM